LLGEEDADQAGPPGGVVTAQAEGELPEGLGRGVGPAPAPVGGGESVGAALAAPLEELANGAGRQAERLGDSGRGLAGLVTAENGLTHRQRYRSWHGKFSRRAEEPRCPRQHTASRPAAKLDVRFRGVT
jgi:hypothetical protein